jgi:DNA repair exonuclease SbcCD ATPase subunit
MNKQEDDQVVQNETVQPNPRKEKKSPFDDFLKELESRHSADEKLRIALLFMEKSLSREGNPDFKGFWEARKHCLALFRESISPPERAELWNRFSEFSKEARRLKELSDEQSGYAAEQFEMAIQSIEKDLESVESTASTYADLPAPAQARILIPHWNEYNRRQKELNFLNAYASRVNSLRKELMKTEMRIRIKNQFFDRLSKAGDLLFPRRKELISDLSEAFEKDVEQFASKHFATQSSNVPTFALREEIKEMQGIAKELTLNARAFSTTRTKLSSCWDALKEKESEKRKELSEKKELFEQNAAQLNEKFDEIEKKFEEEGVSPEELESLLEIQQKEMRQKELGRDEVKALKERLFSLREKVDAKLNAKEIARKQAEEERNQKKREWVEGFNQKVVQLLQRADTLSSDEVKVEQEAFLAELVASGLNKTERSEIEKGLKPLKELLKKKKEAALLALPSDERSALTQLNELLEQKRLERNEIKQLLEELRKKAKGSGLDFNRAMELNQTIAEQKSLLEELISSIEELEEKIEGLEQRLE